MMTSPPRVFLSRLEDPEYRRKFIHTLILFYAFVNVGIQVSQNGPALLDLQLITGTDTQEASGFITATSVGGMVGSLMVGVVYGRWNKMLTVSMTLLGAGASAAALPWCSPYALMIGMQFLSALFRAGFFTAATVEVIRLWAPESRVPFQALNLFFSIGASIGPVLTQPFLAPKQDGNGTITNSSVDSYKLIRDSGNINAPLVPTTNVYFAFLITGILFVIGSVAFLVLRCTLQVNIQPVGSSHNYESLEKPLPRCQYLITVFLLFLCIFLSIAVQSPTVSFLPTFTVQYLDWSKADGANVSTVFWLSLAAGRFVFVLLTKYVSPFRYLVFSTIMSILAMVGNIVFSLKGLDGGIWVCTGLFGMCISSQMPAVMMWSEESILKLTPRVVSLFNLAITFPGMVLPPLLGFLMERISQMWVFYLTALLCVLFLVMLLCAFLWTRLVINPLKIIFEREETEYSKE